MKHTLSLAAIVTAMPAFAEDQRQLDAHEHGVSALNVAIEGTTVSMEFYAPGADIVGFEYAAESDEDLATIDLAVTKLSAPLDLFAVPERAACKVIEAQAELDGEYEHDDHGKEGNHDHDGQSTEAGHSEFHAHYVLNCENPDALKQIRFAYFEAFPNATEVEVQIISAAGAQAIDVKRASPVLDL